MDSEVLCLGPASMYLSSCISKNLRYHHEKATEYSYGGGEILSQSALLERAHIKEGLGFRAMIS